MLGRVFEILLNILAFLRNNLNLKKNERKI